MYQGCFILKRVNLLNKLSERFYPEANALSFDWIKLDLYSGKHVFRVICVFINPFCHWSLSVPPENRKHFIFWCFQVVWKETSGMLWLTWETVYLYFPHLYHQSLFRVELQWNVKYIEQICYLWIYPSLNVLTSINISLSNMFQRICNEIYSIFGRPEMKFHSIHI